MNSNVKIIIAVVVIAAVLFAKLYKGMPHTGIAPVKTQTEEPTQSKKDAKPSNPSAPATPNASSGHQIVIDPNANLIYTKHARCRMDCRHISEADIREVLREGHINEAKSQQNQTPCPTYAIEDNRNSDGIRLRIVFAKCEHETKVVTCIDRDDEFACDCK